MEQIIYKCPICGNTFVVVESSGIRPSCCGQPMTIVDAKTEDDGEEKHVPVANLLGNHLTVRVGASLHPSTNEHYIKWILVKTDKSFYFRYLSAGDEPIAVFSLEPDEIVDSIYEYCNIHRLWVTYKCDHCK